MNEEQKQRKELIHQELANPEIYRNPERVKELSREFSRLEKEARTADTDGGMAHNLIMVGFTMAFKSLSV